MPDLTATLPHQSTPADPADGPLVRGPAWHAGCTAPLTVLRELDTSLRGLDEADAAARLAHHGDNRVEPAPRRAGRGATCPRPRARSC